jgi:hypothetical protein
MCVKRVAALHVSFDILAGCAVLVYASGQTLFFFSMLLWILLLIIRRSVHAVRILLLSILFRLLIVLTLRFTFRLGLFIGSMVLQVSLLERGQSFESETIQVDPQFLVGKGGNLDDLLEFGMELDLETANESIYI